MKILWLLLKAISVWVIVTVVSIVSLFVYIAKLSTYPIRNSIHQLINEESLDLPKSWIEILKEKEKKI